VAAPETGSSIGIGGVIWLIVLFAGIVFWAFRPKNRKRFREDSEIPFRDDDRRS